MAGCSVRATMIAYVPLGVSLPGVVRLLHEHGAKITGVTEELRRIVASGSLETVREAARAVEEYGVPSSMISYEVQVVCRLSREDTARPSGRVMKKLPGPKGSTYYAGIVNGRVVGVELKRDGLALVKIGRPARITRLAGPPAPADFVLVSLPDVEDAKRLAAEALRLLGYRIHEGL